MLGRLYQDTAGIQVAMCVMVGTEQKGKNPAMVEKQALHVRGGNTETQTGKLWRPSEGCLCLLHIYMERTQGKWHAGGHECDTVCPNLDF